MASTTFSGPIKAGTIRYNGVTDGTANVGNVLLTQTATITASSSAAVTTTFTIPANSQITNIIPDVVTAFNITSAAITAGTSATGTEYLSGLEATSTGRKAATFTATQLGNMYDVGSNTNVVVAVTPVTSAATTGTVDVTLFYVQK